MASGLIACAVLASKRTHNNDNCVDRIVHAVLAKVEDAHVVLQWDSTTIRRPPWDDAVTGFRKECAKRVQTAHFATSAVSVLVVQYCNGRARNTLVTPLETGST